MDVEMLEAAKAEIRRGLELAHSAVANANLATGKQQAQEAANVELRATIARLEEENAKLRGGAAPAKAEPPASLVRVGGPGAEGYDVPCAAEEGVDLAKCVGAAKFKAWAAGIGSQFLVKRIDFQSLDMFGPRNVGFIKLIADCVHRDTGHFMPGIVVIRGHSVAMLMEITAKETGERFSLMTVQARVPTPDPESLELPAGMLDDGEFKGTAAKEIEEETGMTVSQESLIELTSADQRIYLSPGGLDEGMKFYLHRQTMPLAEIRKLEGRCTGVLDEGEQISLKVLPIAHLRGVYDCKTLVALSLYETFLATHGEKPVSWDAEQCPSYEPKAWDTAARPAADTSASDTSVSIGEDLVKGGYACKDILPCSGDPGVDVKACLGAKPFKEWLANVQPQFDIRKINFQSVDMFGPKVGFVKFETTCVHRATKAFIPGIVFMRGHSVGILMELIAAESGKRYTVLTVQARLPIPDYGSLEIPAGMVDCDGGFVGNAAKELKEETGIEVNGDELVELTGRNAVIKMSPGISDEGIKLYLFRKVLPDAKIAELHEKCTGVAEEGETISLKVLPFDELMASVVDAKSIAALALYNGMPKSKI